MIPHEKAQENMKRLIVVKSDDLGVVLGVGEVSSVPTWPTNTIFHSSDPALPLNDRTPRFLQVLRLYEVVNEPELIIAEVYNQPRLDKRNIPPIWHRGHRVELRYALLGRSQANIHLPPLWEVSVDRELIGTIDGNLSDDKLAEAATAFATRHIDRRLEAKN